MSVWKPLLLILLFVFLTSTQSFAQKRAECHVDAMCNVETKQYVDAVFLLDRCTAYFVNNTSNDGKLLAVTKSHCMPFVKVGFYYGRPAKFNYQNKICNHDKIEDDYLSTYLVYRVLAKTNPAPARTAGFVGSDRVLLEIQYNEDMKDMSVLLLGWTLDANKRDATMIGHPVGDLKSVTRLQYTSTFNRHYYYQIPPYGGYAEYGNSGSPVLNSNGQVFADMMGGTFKGCENSLSTGVAVSRFNDEFEVFKPYLDEANTNKTSTNQLRITLPHETSSTAVVPSQEKTSHKSASYKPNYDRFIPLVLLLIAIALLTVFRTHIKRHKQK